MRIKLVEKPADVLQEGYEHKAVGDRKLDIAPQSTHFGASRDHTGKYLNTRPEYNLVNFPRTVPVFWFSKVSRTLTGL